MEMEMNMAEITLEIPDELAQKLGGQPKDVASEVRLSLALYWCNRGELSLGKAARLAGIPYATFLEEAARRKVEIIRYNLDDLSQETLRPLPEGVNLQEIEQGLGRDPTTRG